MGLTTSAVFNRLLCKRPKKIIMIGLDGAGKTTALFKLKFGEVVGVIPTIGFNIETIEYKNSLFAVWDLRGGGRSMQLWRHYLDNTEGVIFVVDASNRERIEEAEDILRFTLAGDDFKAPVLLIFANKQDLPNSMSTAEVTDKLKLNSLRNVRWHVQATSAIEGNGLYEGLNWLLNELAKNYFVWF